MQKEDTKLIILRGPSGSGKSSVAEALRKASSRSIVILEQDYYRNKVLKHDEDIENIRRMVPAMIISNALTAFSSAYDVIIDGIFRVHSYKEMFNVLIREHPKHNYMFVFDVTFDETLRRHQMRPKATEFGEKEMAGWWHPPELSGFDFEEKTPQESNLEETVAHIKEVTGI